MECKEFKEYLPEFIEDEIPSYLKEPMKVHMDNCKKCRQLYYGIVDNRKDFVKFGEKDVEGFRSQREGILANIDKDKYKNNLRNKANIFIRRNVKYIVTAAAITFLALMTPFFLDSINKSKSYDDKIDPKCETKGTKEVANTKPGYKDAQVEKELKVLREEKQIGVSPWHIVYSDSSKILFYNYSHLLAYSYELNEVYRTIAFGKLGLSEQVQGDSTMAVEASPNGRHVLLSNHNDSKSEKYDVYIVDLEQNRTEKLITENRNDIAVDWSSNSKYLGIGVKDNPKAYVYSLEEGKLKELKSFDKGSLEKVCVSDSGKAVVDIGDKRYSYTSNYEKPDSIVKEPIFKFNGDRWVYYKDYGVYEYAEEKSNKILSIIGKMGSPSYIRNKVYFKAGDDLNCVVNMDTLKTYYYNEVARGNELYPNQEGDIAIADDNTVFYGNKKEGKKIKRDNGDSFSGNIKFKDKNTLVEIDFKDNARYLGEFTIIQRDIDSGEAKVIYDNKK